MSKGHKGQWRKDSSGEPRGRIHEATEKREGIGEEEEEMVGKGDKEIGRGQIELGGTNGEGRERRMESVSRVV